MIKLILIGVLCITQVDIHGQSEHQVWTNLLKRHVTEAGIVNYNGFKGDSGILNSYLSYLSENGPKSSWTPNRTLAYWINAYNAFTIKLVTQYYPIKSIKEIGGKIPFVNSSWDIKFIKINDEILDLNNIEHSKIRKEFNDPRIHMALVCASKSCPILMNEAFMEDRLEEQLDLQSRKFLSDVRRNVLSKNKLEISMIFKWYKSDFKGVGGVRSFLKKYSPVSFSDNAKISYLEYNWNLND